MKLALLFLVLVDITGRIAPIDPHTVKARFVTITATQGSSIYQTRTNPFGYYRLSVPAGTYTVSPSVRKAPSGLGFEFEPDSRMVDATSPMIADFTYSNYLICFAPCR